MTNVRLREPYFAASGGSLYGGIDMRFQASIEQGGSNHRILIPVNSIIKLDVGFGGSATKTIARVAHPLAWSTLNLQRDVEMPVQGVHIPLTPSAVVHLENLRDGADVKFKVRAELMFLGFPVKGGDPESVTMNGELEHEVPRSQWVERYLQAWGFEDLEIWEVRTGIVQPHQALVREYERLRNAVSDLDHGHWDAAHASCREAVESLRKRKSQVTDWGAVEPEAINRLFNFLSLAVHQEAAVGPDWRPDRADSILAVTLTKGILDRLSQHLHQDRSKDV